MQAQQTNLIVISGPVGVGKTTLSEELSHLLNNRQIAHTIVDLDGLSKTYPRAEEDPYGEKVALANLKAVWANSKTLGTRNLIIARVIETREGLRRIERTVGARKSLLVQLSANDDSLRERVRQRELGKGRAWHEERALDLSRKLAKANLADIYINTDDRSIAEVAVELLSQVVWR